MGGSAHQRLATRRRHSAVGQPDACTAARRDRPSGRASAAQADLESLWARILYDARCMPHGGPGMALKDSPTVQTDGSLAVNKYLGEDTAVLNATSSTFAEPARMTETRSVYQLTAASIWRARRHGLSLAEIMRTLETHSQTETPANVRPVAPAPTY